MSTQAAPARARPPRHATHDRIFFGIMTLLMIATILLGFRATYFPLGAKPAALGSSIIVVHAALFSTFLALFLVQVAFVSARKVRWHMKLGLWIYCLAAIMVPIGVLAAASQIKRDLASGRIADGADPLTFSLVSVMGMVMFGSLIACSYLMRRHPQTHKRLALYATLSMMDAGCDRWPWDKWHIGRSWSPWVYTVLLLLPVLYDLLSRHRVLRVTMFAAPYVWILNKLEIPIGHTAAWHAVANFMLKHWT